MLEQQARGGMLIVGGGFAGASLARLLGKARRDDRQPRELHALHAAAARGRVGDARAAPRRRAAAPDVPARRAPARPRDRLAGPRRADGRRSTTEDGERPSATSSSSSRSARSSRVLPVPGLAEHGARLQVARRRDRAAQPRPAPARGGRRAPDDAERARASSAFVFVGAGYAGVEALAELSDLVRDALRFYPRLRDAPQRWVLVDAAPTILPEIPSRLGEYAARQLARRGIEIRVATTLASLDARGGDALRRRADPDARRSSGRPACRRNPLLGRARAAARRARAGASWTRCCASRAPTTSGRSATAPACRTSHAAEPDPPTCQHALRQARRLAKNLRGDPQPYRYRMLGQVATLGRYKGIADVLGLRLRGFPGWFVTRTYHLYQLPLLSRKLRVVIDWTTSLFFRRDIAELGMLGHPQGLRRCAERARVPSIGSRRPCAGAHGAVRRTAAACFRDELPKRLGPQLPPRRGRRSPARRELVTAANELIGALDAPRASSWTTRRSRAASSPGFAAARVDRRASRS